MKPQNERLLAYLQEHGSIGPFESWKEIGIYRLGARIWDLKQQGHRIVRELEKVPNQFGETCRVARYRLVAAPETHSTGSTCDATGQTGLKATSGMGQGTFVL